MLTFENGLQKLATANVKKIAGALGFKTVLAWHFIVLFTPQLSVNQFAAFDDLVFARQLILYLSLALSFLIVSFFRDKLQGIIKTLSLVMLHSCVAVLSIITTSVALIVSVADGFPMGVLLTTTGLLGCCEALSIHLWIHYLLKSRTNKKRRALVIDMISGTIIAFFTLSLQQPVSLIIIAALPGIAGFSLMAVSLSENHQVREFSTVIPKQTQRVLFRRFIRNHLPSAVFALTFGLMQGAFIETDVVFFLASSPFMLLGIIVSGVVIYQIKEKGGSYEDIDTMHRISLILLVVGVLGLSFFREISSAYFSKSLLLAGFVLFDFGALALSMSMARKVGLAKAHLIDKGRSLVYFGFALGLSIAFLGCRLFDEIYDDALINSVGGIALLLLVVTVLMRLNRATPTERVLVEESVSLSSIQEERSGVADTIVLDADSRVSQKISWHDACVEVARVYQLSPREIEVFMMLGKGRNAEYVQGKLFISLHTAKSHIANIYQKLGVHSIQEMLDLIELFAQ